MNNLIPSPLVNSSPSQPSTLPEEVGSILRPFFKLIEQVAQNALQAYQQGKASHPFQSIEELQHILVIPSKLLEKKSLDLLVSLNRDNQKLNDELTKAHKHLIEATKTHHIQLEQMQKLSSTQLSMLQLRAAVHINHLLSLMVADKQRTTVRLHQQEINIQKELGKLSQHRKNVQTQASSLDQSLQMGLLGLENKKKTARRITAQRCY